MIVRENLPEGVIAAQLVHAAGESSPGNLDEGTFAIVLAVPNEDGLCQLAARLDGADVAHVVVREPDAPYRGAAMAIGVRPAPRSQLRRHFSNLPLFRGSSLLPGSANASRRVRWKRWLEAIPRRFMRP